MTSITIQQALQDAYQQFTDLDECDAMVDAKTLLCHVLEKNSSHLIAWPEKVLTPSQQQSFLQLTKRRATGEPVAYIIGHREFWSLDLLVTPATLIPRPDTEILVEQALERIPTDAQWNIADLGTGSGAIALAIASERLQCHIFAVDISQQALEVAQSNAQRLNISNISFFQGSWLQPLTEQKLNMVLSNPPYIESTDPHLKQGDVRFEPPGALSSGTDGLDDIRKLIDDSYQQLESNGWLLLEHGYHQAEEIMALMKQQAYSGVIDYRDYGGNDRVACGQR